MEQQIVQINFEFKNSKEAFEEGAAKIATMFATIPGLQWKIWLMNADKKEAGGIYLFEDKASADNYLRSDLLGAVTANPDFANFNVKQFSMLEAPGKTTNAPVNAFYESTR